MYCSGCGTQVQTGLNYCNRCGGRVAKSDSESTAADIWQAISYVGGFGFIAYIFVILVMVRSGADTAALIAISFLYLATLFGICFMLLRRTETFSKSRLPAVPAEIESPPPAYLRPVTTSQLGEPAEPGISVTEHTTKTLDEVLIERK